MSEAIDNRKLNAHSDFRQGQKLKALFWDEGSLTVEDNNVESITICMECGQMAGVPWATVCWIGGKINKYNLANVEGVEL